MRTRDFHEQDQPARSAFQPRVALFRFVREDGIHAGLPTDRVPACAELLCPREASVEQTVDGVVSLLPACLPRRLPNYRIGRPAISDRSGILARGRGAMAQPGNHNRTRQQCPDRARPK